MRSIHTLLCALIGLAVSQSTSPTVQRIDLGERLSAGKLRVVNRQATNPAGLSVGNTSDAIL